MTGNENLFAFLSRRKGGTVTFGDNNKGRIIGHGSIGKSSSFIIENVLLVDGLMHNLLSISQLCDKGYEVIFDKSKCLINESKNNQVIFEGQKNGNVYTINIAKYINHEKCLASIQEDSWLWHRRLGHINMDKISYINKNDLVRGLPMIK